MKVMKTIMHSQLGPWECILIICYELVISSHFCQVHSQADLFTGIHYYLQKLKSWSGIEVTLMDGKRTHLNSCLLLCCQKG
jgi:hypothetical protein